MRRVKAETMQYYDQAVTDKMMTKYGMSRLEALKEFTGSETYAMLLDADYGMTMFGADGIFDIWENEKVTGSPQSSIYMREENQEYDYE